MVYVLIFCKFLCISYVSNLVYNTSLDSFPNYNSRWFTEARIPYEFRPRHALLTMHVWFLHKRLLADRVDSHLALLVQVRVLCTILTYNYGCFYSLNIIFTITIPL